MHGGAERAIWIAAVMRFVHGVMVPAADTPALGAILVSLKLETTK
jgi:hypothetical protein